MTYAVELAIARNTEGYGPLPKRGEGNLPLKPK